MKKKLLALVLIVAICTSLLVGCNLNPNNGESNEDKESIGAIETEPNNNTTEQTNQPTDENKISEEWKKFEVIVDDHTITLPCTYKELKEITGFSVSEFAEEDEVPSKWFTPSNLFNKDGEEFCCLALQNTSDEDAPAKDGMVVGISHDYWTAEEVDTKVVFVGLQVGDKISKQDLVKRFGEPDEVDAWRTDKEFNKEQESDTYYWYINAETPDAGSFKITVNIHTDLIEEISMFCSPVR